MFNRRQIIHTALGTGTAVLTGGLNSAWARPSSAGNLGIPAITGTRFDLSIGKFPIRINGRLTEATGVNGSVPAPLIRFREGDRVTLNVTNNLAVDSSIHWHGLLVPFQLDGVPGVTFPGIRPGETFTYEYSVPQNGTYWYHSHSGLQEQSGHYGPIIIDPKGHDPVAYDLEYVLVLGDWTYMNPHHLFARLKKNPESLNFNQPTISDKIPMRGLWDRMRMSPRDIADVGGKTYTYVINGHATEDNFNMVFKPGERVRLRIINAAAMTLFNIRMPGLPMTVVQADGLNIQPVETDEFQMGVAETYDVIVQPTEERAFAFVAESIDRSGQVVATLGPRPGMRASVPALRPVPLLTMKDMGMDHSGMAHEDMADDMAIGESAMEMGAGPVTGPMTHTMPDGTVMQGAKHSEAAKMTDDAMNHSSMRHSPMSHASGAHSMPVHGPDPHGPEIQLARTEAVIRRGPAVANIAEMPASRLHEPGIGLDNVPHRTLSYSQLRSLAPNPDRRRPEREVVVHLTSNMERYMWSFDGVKFSEVKKAIIFQEGERVRLTMVNNTMMPHPIHLHGMFFDLVIPGYDSYGDAGHHRPRKHTVIVKPGEKLSVDVSADHIGDWAFHCHLLFHMHAGMMQVVSVLPGPHAGKPMEKTGAPDTGSKPGSNETEHPHMRHHEPDPPEMPHDGHHKMKTGGMP